MIILNANFDGLCVPDWVKSKSREILRDCSRLINEHIRKVEPKTRDFWWNPRPESRDPSCR